MPVGPGPSWAEGVTVGSDVGVGFGERVGFGLGVGVGVGVGVDEAAQTSSNLWVGGAGWLVPESPVPQDHPSTSP